MAAGATGKAVREQPRWAPGRRRWWQRVQQPRRVSTPSTAATCPGSSERCAPRPTPRPAAVPPEPGSVKAPHAAAVTRLCFGCAPVFQHRAGPPWCPRGRGREGFKLGACLGCSSWLRGGGRRRRRTRACRGASLSGYVSAGRTEPIWSRHRSHRAAQHRFGLAPSMQGTARDAGTLPPPQNAALGGQLLRPRGPVGRMSPGRTRCFPRRAQVTEWHQGWMELLLHGRHFVSSALQLSGLGHWEDTGTREGSTQSCGICPRLPAPEGGCREAAGGCRLARWVSAGRRAQEAARRAPGWGSGAISLPVVQARDHGTSGPALLTPLVGHKLRHRKFRLNMRKNFFPLRVTEHWPRLPGEAVESPSLEIFKTHLDKVLCSLL